MAKACGFSHLHWSRNVARVLGFSENWQRQFHKRPQATGLEAGTEGLHTQEPARKLLQHFYALTLQHYQQPSAVQIFKHTYTFAQYDQICSQYKAFSAAEEPLIN